MGRIKKLVIGLVVIVVIIIAVGLGYYWWTTTPQYALSQIKKAYATHDTSLAFKYIDEDAVFNGLWSQVEDRISQQEASSTGDGWSELGNMIGAGVVENMKPTIKAQFDASLENAIKTSTTTTDISGLASNYKITYDGSDAVVTSSSTPISLHLEKEGTSYWRVVEVDGVNLYPDTSTSSTTQS